MIIKERGLKIRASNGNRIPLEITAVKKGTTAFIVIKGSIYSWSTASSYDVSKKIKDFKKEGATNASLYVSTGGGDCFETQEILNIVKDEFGAENVKVRIGAVCASAGTRFCTEFYTSAKKNSKFMIHKPIGNLSGNEDQIESGLKLIKDMTLEYKKAYAKKMNKTEDEIEKLWAKGDYWMTATEAKNFGLIDEIEDEDEQIDATAHLQLVACGAPNIPKAKNTKTEIKRMELSVLAVKLGLPANATKAQVDAKLDQVTATAATADGLVQAAADKEKADKSAKVKALLDQGEIDKKIDAVQRPLLETLEPEAIKAFLANQKAITAIFAELNPAATVEATAEQAKWTFEDYQEKNPTAFIKLPEEKQNALIEANYKEN